MAVKIDVSGLNALRASLKDVGDAIESELSAALEAEAADVAADAQANVRVDSGDLRDSITAEVDGLDASVAPRDDLLEGDYVYAMVNEFGRASDPGQPYMVPAAEVARQRWPQRASEAVRRGARG